jgi:ParB family transcriptional regulator, chromosome partitioning protein
MRHDLHFVEQLGRPGGVPVGRMIPIEDIEPNPEQPRRSLGDLGELAASIREKGLIEPLVVRARDKRYQIVAGERRYRAALEVGLAEVPCVVRECTDGEALEIALIENLQRKDLDPFEEADGLKALAEQFGHTHEQIAERVGKSRSSITESLALSAMPAPVRDRCRLADISSKSTLLQVVRQGNIDEMVALLDQLGLGGAATRAVAREAARAHADRRSPGRPRAFLFKYRPESTKAFHLSLRFRKSDATREEIIAALQEALAAIMDDSRAE